MLSGRRYVVRELLLRLRALELTYPNGHWSIEAGLSSFRPPTQLAGRGGSFGVGSRRLSSSGTAGGSSSGNKAAGSGGSRAGSGGSDATGPAAKPTSTAAASSKGSSKGSSSSSSSGGVDPGHNPPGVEATVKQLWGILRARASLPAQRKHAPLPAKAQRAGHLTAGRRGRPGTQQQQQQQQQGGGSSGSGSSKGLPPTGAARRRGASPTRLKPHQKRPLLDSALPLHEAMRAEERGAQLAARSAGAGVAARSAEPAAAASASAAAPPRQVPLAEAAEAAAAAAAAAAPLATPTSGLQAQAAASQHAAASAEASAEAASGFVVVNAARSSRKRRALPTAAQPSQAAEAPLDATGSSAPTAAQQGAVTSAPTAPAAPAAPVAPGPASDVAALLGATTTWVGGAASEAAGAKLAAAAAPRPATQRLASLLPEGWRMPEGKVGGRIPSGSNSSSGSSSSSGGGAGPPPPLPTQPVSRAADGAVPTGSATAAAGAGGSPAVSRHIIRMGDAAASAAARGEPLLTLPKPRQQPSVQQSAGEAPRVAAAFALKGAPASPPPAAAGAAGAAQDAAGGSAAGKERGAAGAKRQAEARSGSGSGSGSSSQEGREGREGGSRRRKEVSPKVAELKSLKQAKELNNHIIRMCDAVDFKLDSGKVPLNERVDLANQAIDSMRKALASQQPLDAINLSTFMHRISRMVAHPKLETARAQLQYLDVMEELASRLESLLEMQLQQKPGGPAIPRNAFVTSRSLSTAMWACGNIRFPLSKDQLDKMAGVAMLQYQQLSAHHLSMIILSLYSYAPVHQPFGGRLLKVLVERAGQMPRTGFEPHSLLNVLCPVAALQCEVSQAALDHFALTALWQIDRMQPPQLGGLLWSMAKLQGTGGGSMVLDGKLFQAAVARSFDLLHKFPPVSLCNVLYGCGAMRYQPGAEFLDASAAHIGANLASYNSQSLANLMWSWARLGYSPDRFQEERELPTFYVLRPGDPMRNAYEDEEGYVWRDGGRFGAAASQQQLLGGQAFPTSSADSASRAFVTELREILHRRVQRAEERRAANEAAAKAGAAAVGSGLKLEAKDAATATAGPSTAGAGSSGDIASLAQRIAAARAKRASHYALLTMVEQELAAVRAKYAAVPATPAIPSVLPQGAQPGVTRGRRHARLRLAAAARAAPAAPAAAAAEPVDEHSVVALARRILGNSGGEGAAGQGSGRHRIPGPSPGSYFRATTNPVTGQSTVRLDYDRNLLKTMFREIEHSIRSLAAFLLGNAAPVMRPSRFSPAAAATAAAAAAAAAEPPEAAVDGGEAGNGSRSSSGSGSGLGASPPPEELLSDLEVAILAGVELPTAGLLPDDASLPDQIAAVEGTPLDCDTTVEVEDDAVPAAPAGAALPAGHAGRAAPAGQAEQEELESGEGSVLQAEASRGEGDLGERGEKPAGPAQRAVTAAAGGEEEDPEQQQEQGKGGASRAAGTAELDIAAMTPRQLKAHLFRQADVYKPSQEALDRWAGEPRVTLDAVAQACIDRLHTFSPQEIATTLWAFASQRHVHPPLFAAVVAAAAEREAEFEIQALSIMCWACAVLREAPPPSFLQLVVRRLKEDMQRKGLNVQAMCNVSWALAVFDSLDSTTFVSLLEFLPHDSAELSRKLPSVAWCQLFQCALYLEAKEGRHYSTFLPARALPLAQRAWEARGTTTSLYQADVQAVLDSMGVPFEIEYSPRDKFFVIDIAVRGSGNTKLAIEVDGPHHFSANPPFRPLASTDMRNRLLARHGWRVVSIPCDHWQKMVSLPEKQLYLHNHVLRHIDQYARFEDS